MKCNNRLRLMYLIPSFVLLAGSYFFDREYPFVSLLAVLLASLLTVLSLVMERRRQSQEKF